MRTRIISGAVGVALLIIVLFFHSTPVLPASASLMTSIMLFELLRAVKLEKNVPILIATEISGIATPFLYSFYYDYPEGIIGGADIPMINGRITLFSFGITLFSAFVIFVNWLRHHKKIRYEQIFFALACMVVVPQAMSTTVRIDRMDRENGLFYLIMGLCGAWIADSGAYFMGVTLGKHKLCPEISPKKTIEGFIGGIVTSGIVYAVAFSVYFHKISPVLILLTFVVGAVCGVIGTLGDLSASMVKRQIGFKDYGKIMPGHGGLMDRFDSVIFVLPTFYIFISIIEDFIG